MLSFFRSCQENTCDVPKPKQDSKELPSNWMINFATGIQIFRGQKFTKFTSVLIGSCKHFERMQLQDGLTGGITLQAGRQDRSSGWTNLPLHTASETGHKVQNQVAQGAPWQISLADLGHSQPVSRRSLESQISKHNVNLSRLLRIWQKSWQKATRARFKTFLTEMISPQKLRNWHISFHILL